MLYRPFCWSEISPTSRLEHADGLGAFNIAWRGTSFCFICVIEEYNELTNSHSQIKMETLGKIFFINLDSTNGTRVDDVELEAHKPYELTLSKPIKVKLSAGEYEFV